MTRAALETRVASLIDALSEGGRDDATRDALLAELGAYQAEHVAPYAKLCAATTPRDAYPALPTDVYRFARVASHPPEQDIRVFRTSGTTQSARGEHPVRSLALYDRAAYAAARRMLFPDREAMPLVILAPRPSELPDSSLSYMLGRFTEWFGNESAWVYSDDSIDIEGMRAALERAIAAGTPVALLGTSFALVHALDGLAGRRFALPEGSRVMQTGGYKGRSRVLEPAALRALLTESFGVPDALIIAEYGMTELSSQMYETTLRAALLGAAPGPRRLWVPGWVRAIPVDPSTLLPVPEGELGLLRLDDSANLDSVSAIQTSDLARIEDGELVLLGRAEGATPRGCALAADTALGRRC